LIAVSRLADADVPGDVIHFELFDGKHGGIDDRHPIAFAWLRARIAP
jgi:hypothetical protein